MIKMCINNAVYKGGSQDTGFKFVFKIFTDYQSFIVIKFVQLLSFAVMQTSNLNFSDLSALSSCKWFPLKHEIAWCMNTCICIQLS